MKTLSLSTSVLLCSLASAHAATSSAAFNGSWDLAFVTRSGTCDPAYNFTVNISNGFVTHPNLVRFRGYVLSSGSFARPSRYRTSTHLDLAVCLALPARARGAAARETDGAWDTGPPRETRRLIFRRPRHEENIRHRRGQPWLSFLRRWRLRFVTCPEMGVHFASWRSLSSACRVPLARSINTNRV